METAGPASNVDVDEAKSKPATIRKLICGSSPPVEIFPKRGYKTEMSFHLPALNLYHKERISSSMQVHGNNYTLDWFTVTASTKASPVNIEQKFVIGRTQPKQLRANIKLALVHERYRYQSLQKFYRMHHLNTWLYSSLSMSPWTKDIIGPFFS